MNHTDTTITLAKQSDGNMIFSEEPFDPKITGEIIAFPRISPSQLVQLKNATPEKVQSILHSLVCI